MQRNVKFSYLYRDGGNYKKWADVVFSNPEGLSIDLVNKALKHAFMQDGLFIAHQIRIPDSLRGVTPPRMITVSMSSARSSPRPRCQTTAIPDPSASLLQRPTARP
jgi:hypothetical protein